MERNHIVLLQRAATMNPYDAGNYFRLCRALCASGQKESAKNFFSRWMHLAPDDRAIPYIRAAMLGESMPGRAPEEYIAWEFDRFADSFDDVLTRLDYRVPELLGAAVAAQLGAHTGALRVLDAGCGTGLCGRVVEPFARELVGVDLSEAMLDIARRRDCYDTLVQHELVRYLTSVTAPFDLIVSGDCLIYFGDLAPVFAGFATALCTGGLLAFSLEARAAEAASDGFELGSTGRYKHGAAYTRARLAEAGFEVRAVAETFVRMEEGVPVAGFIVTAVKR